VTQSEQISAMLRESAARHAFMADLYLVLGAVVLFTALVVVTFFAAATMLILIGSLPLKARADLGSCERMLCYEPKPGS